MINQHQEDIDNLKGLSGEITLYEVDIANTNYGTVTLNDDLSNYRIIEIYAATDDKHVVYQKVASPNGKYVSFSAALVGQANFFTKCKVYYMNGNTIKLELMQVITWQVCGELIIHHHGLEVKST